MSPELTKAAHYIEILDQARCAGNWDEVPELVRKVKKHAPQRTCLGFVAETEHAITQASKRQQSTPLSLESSGLGHLITPLEDAIGSVETFAEDKFQAQVCLGWLYWICQEHRLAAQRIPKSIEQDFAQLDGVGEESLLWTKVCALKGVYIKGASLVKTGATAEALMTFESALPMLSLVTPKFPGGSAEPQTWTELLLTQYCMLSSQNIKEKPSLLRESETLSAFRAWALFWERQRGLASSLTGGINARSSIPRRQVWKEYYITLSSILQNSLPYPTTAIAAAYADAATRLQQREELQCVETRYENLLLQEVQFPRADQTNEEVEEWADLVIQNWRVLSSWDEQELGQGGRDALSRRVLDIIYRAATKTFHSTSILRHLFAVHLVVGEFNLAFKAFDTYMEIVKKGKARAEKTGIDEKTVDDSETVIKTASECIRALCRYGSLKAAEKAKDIGHFFEEWLEKHYPEDTTAHTPNGDGQSQVIVNGDSSETAAPVSPTVIAVAWRSIGIGKAQCARLTVDASSRSEMQLQAIKCLRKALLPMYKSTESVETLFALALVLAERRELNAAIELVKKALLPPISSNKKSDDLGPSGGNFARERGLIPLWHLLALLLSARQEYITAARACEGAFEQFLDPKNLFGEANGGRQYRSEHLNLQAISEKSLSHTKGVVDEMSDFEKETVLEVKMTQLALIEVHEGAEVAVNACDELLALYSRLFEEPQGQAPKTASSKAPPKSAATLRSIKGSLFGRSRRSMRSRMSSVSEKSDIPTRPQTTQTYASTVKRAPTIHVTNENGGITAQEHHEKLQKRSMSLTRENSHRSIRNRSSSAGRTRTGNRTVSEAEAERVPLQVGQLTTQEKVGHIGQQLNTTRSSQVVSPKTSSVALSATQDRRPSSSSKLHSSKSKPLPPPPMYQTMPQKEQSLKPNLSAEQDCLSPYASTRSSNILVVRFPKEQERRRRIGVLVRVWLLIAGFYRRAEIYDDAKGAIDEAYKLVDSLEMDLSRDSSGSVSIHDGGFGSGKSVEHLWGDVWSERGYLSTAKGNHYIALSEFEAALTHFADHPSAIVGLSSILLDIYTELLPPPSSIPSLSPTTPLPTPSQSVLNTSSTLLQDSVATLSATSTSPSTNTATAPGPLGLPAPRSTQTHLPNTLTSDSPSSTVLLDRLAARDRAYGLLSGLTKLGSGWNYSEAWFTLARAYEEGGQTDKAREVLWWCVELEEGRAVRGWECVAVGGYVL